MGTLLKERIIFEIVLKSGLIPDLFFVKYLNLLFGLNIMTS